MAWTIYTLGATDALPPHDGVTWHANPARSADAVVVAGPIDAATWAAESRTLSPLLPLGVLGPLPPFLPADFNAPAPSAAAIDEMLAVFTPIRERLSELAGDPRAQADSERPDSVRPDSERLTLLGLAISRGGAIEVQRSWAVPSTVIYPLLRDRPGLEALEARPALEALANLELLERRFVARVLTCPICASGRLAAYESCPECHSAHLFEEPLVHHYRCGYQDGESRFVAGIEMVCPKCKHELRHFGIDYGRPGTIIRCLACQQVMTDPAPAFHCLDCQTVLRGEQALPVDWHRYTPTERGLAAARMADLQKLDMAELAGAMPRTYPLKDFILLAREQVLVAGRYGRAMSVATIRVENMPEMRLKIGPTDAAQVTRLFVQIVVESMRDTDFVTVRGEDMMVVALPETARADAEAVLRRVQGTAQATLAFPLTLKIDAVDGDAAAPLLEQLAA